MDSVAIDPLLTVVGACCNRDTAYRLYRRIRLLPMADGGRILPGCIVRNPGFSLVERSAHAPRRGTRCSKKLVYNGGRAGV